MNPYIFRKYDIRGIVESDFTPDVVTDLGRAFGTYVKRSGGKRVSISGDIRLTTPRLIDNFSKGLLETGIIVLDMGIMPTPANYFSMFHLDIDGAVQITGSHNPPEFNGFKISYKQGAFYGDQIQDLKELIESKDFEIGVGSIERVDIMDSYQLMLKENSAMVSQPKIDYINRLIAESLSEGDDTIELKGKFIGDEGVEALVQSSDLANIEDLDLSNNNITWRGAVQLFRCDKFKNLKRLYLNDNNLANKGALALVEASFLGGLSVLDIHFNAIEAPGGMAIAKCSNFQKLQVLNFQENQVGDDTLIAIAKNPSFGNIRKLNFYRTGITIKAIKVLARSKVLKKVKHLNIGRNYLHPDSAKALADTKTLVNVETLLMIENYLGDDGVKNIMESESFINLKMFRVL